MKSKLFLVFPLLIIILGVLPGLSRAQSTEATLANLLVELWPEYDSSDVLVIYRAELSNATPLPATVTFTLPGSVEQMHAIATEQNGGLFNIDPANIQQERVDDNLLLTVTVETPRIHLEYYDPAMLTQEGESRQLNFTYTANYPVESARFQVQQPLQSGEMALTPPASGTFTDQNGFTYQVIETAGLEPGDAIVIAATYQRATDTPSAQLLPTSEHAADIQLVTDEGGDNGGMQLGYVLVGAGLALLLGTGGYWWWTNRAVAEVPTRRAPAASRPQRQKKRVEARRSREQPANGGGYCYQCGTALRPDAKFCHVCGAERRTG